MKKSERNELWVAAAHHSIEEIKKLNYRANDIVLMLEDYAFDENGAPPPLPILCAFDNVAKSMKEMIEAIKKEISDCNEEKQEQNSLF